MDILERIVDNNFKLESQTNRKKVTKTYAPPPKQEPQKQESQKQYKLPKFVKPIDTDIPTKEEPHMQQESDKRYKLPDLSFNREIPVIVPSHAPKELKQTFKVPSFISKKQVEPETSSTGILNIHYNIPKRNDIAVLIVFFDYVGSVRILMNCLFMIEKLKLANIPVFTIELVIKGCVPKISDAIHVYGSSYLFQKEQLIRILERSIPPNFTKLACFDADILFDNPNWYDNLSNLLDSVNIVQCFENAYWLDITYTENTQTAVTCLSFDKKAGSFFTKEKMYHPGFAWAFTRVWYNACGFYDLAIVGCGDSIFSYAILDMEFLTSKTRLYSKTKHEWLTKLKKISYKYLPLNVYHLFHGPMVKRQYVSRDEPFEKVDDVSTIITTNNDGVLELTNSELNNAMLEMFKRREDDGV